MTDTDQLVETVQAAFDDQLGSYVSEFVTFNHTEEQIRADYQPALEALDTLVSRLKEAEAQLERYKKALGVIGSASPQSYDWYQRKARAALRPDQEAT
jgi:hypothetical protein